MSEQRNRKLKPGDWVTFHFMGGSQSTRRLTERDAADMNAGENPMYPWRVRKWELTDV